MYSPTGFQYRTASVNGMRLHYVIGGSGPAVLLLRGWPQTWYEWRHVLCQLSGYTIIAPDLRGFGYSSDQIRNRSGPHGRREKDRGQLPELIRTHDLIRSAIWPLAVVAIPQWPAL